MLIDFTDKPEEKIKQYGLIFEGGIKYPKGHYVYFLYQYVPVLNDDILSYVGQTTKLNQRILQHSSKDCEFARYLPLGSLFDNQRYLLALEKYFLVMLRPPLNHPTTTKPRCDFYSKFSDPINIAKGVDVDYEWLIGQLGGIDE